MRTASPPPADNDPVLADGDAMKTAETGATSGREGDSSSACEGVRYMQGLSTSSFGAMQHGAVQHGLPTPSPHAATPQQQQSQQQEQQVG